MKKVFNSAIISFILLSFITTASAQATIEPLEEPYDRTNISDHTSTVQIINLTENGDPINETNLENEYSDWELGFIYNKTGGNKDPLTWIDKGYYFAEFDINSSKGLYNEFEVRETGDLSDPGEVNATETYNLGNMTVNIQNDYSDLIKPDRDFKPNIEVLDNESNSETNANVNFYLTNVTWTSDMITTYHDENGVYSSVSEKNFSLDFNSKYILHANASNSNLEYNDSYGSESIVFETAPELQANIQDIDSNGCELIANEFEYGVIQQNLGCERGAKIDPAVNITSSEANNVNMTFMFENKSSNNWIKNKTYNLTKESGLYNTSFKMPEINTSKYGEVVRLRFNISNDDIEITRVKDIYYYDYKLQENSNPFARPPSYTIKFAATKQFSVKPIEQNRLEGYINVTDPNSTQLTVFNVSEMEYNDGVFKKEISLDFDEEPGIYKKHFNIENIYGQESNLILPTKFNLTNLSRSFGVTPNDLEKDVEREKIYQYDLNITNLGAGNITYEAKEEIENLTSVNNDSVISINEDEEETVNVSFNITEVQDYEGEIKFMDNSSSYNETVDVELESPSCTYRNGSYCVVGGLNVQTDEEGDEISRTINFRHLGSEDVEETITPSTEGNISSFIEIDPGIIEVNTENYTFNFEINFTANSPGYYNGTVNIGDLEVPASLDSDFQGSELSFSTNDAIDLGTMPEGSDKDVELTVENTGNLPINSIEAESPFFEEVTVDSDITLNSDNTENITLSFSGIDGGGTVDLTAANNDETSTESLQATVETIPDLTEKKSDLDSRLTDLQRRVDGDLRSNLEGLSTDISEMDSAYKKENYEKANRIYSTVSSTLTQVESQAAASEQDNNQTSEPDPEPEPPSNPNPNQGDSNLLPIIIGIVVLLLIGFVATTSIIPEEGDPLYNVLGK